MLLSLVIIIAALAVLIWGADRFVCGASAMARKLGISPMLIGLTIVALGTSAPEIVVAIISSLKHNPGLAIGSAIGSNIANVGLVLALTALVSPLTIQTLTIKREYTILLVITCITAYLLWDGVLSRLDGILLFCLLAVLIITAIIFALKKRAPNSSSDIVYESMSWKLAIFNFLLGAILLPTSSDVIVNHAIVIAKGLGVSSEFIGLTVIAIGTCLPELAASLVGTHKGEHDLAIGNVIGSNIFNLIAVLPFAGVISPSRLNPTFMTIDLPALLIATLGIFFVSYSVKMHQGQPGLVTRVEGCILFVAYIIYLTIIWHTHSQAIVPLGS